MAKLNLNDFHSYSAYVSKKFDEFIINEIDSRNDSDVLKELYQKFIEKKIGTNHQRVTLVFAAAKYFGIDTEKHFEEILRLSAVPELLIWSEYAFNWVTDGKNNDSGSKFEDNINLITSQYLLTEVTNFLPDRMLKRYLELYRWGIYGCLIVEKDLRITNWSNLQNFDYFWKLYSDNHCIPDVGALYAYCFELVYDYFEINLDLNLVYSLQEIGFHFGRGLQINGDISDFMIPNKNMATTEKRPEKDYFIDLRTNRITYPSWLLMDELQKSENKEDMVLLQEIISSAENRIYPNEYFYNKVYSALKKFDIVKKIYVYLRHEKERLIKVISSLGIENEGSQLLKLHMVVLNNNKFKKALLDDFYQDTDLLMDGWDFLS